MANETAMPASSGMLGTPVDCKIEVMVDQNQLQAQVILHEPKYGGKPPTYEAIIKEIDVQRIKHGIDHELLKAMVDDNLYDTKRCFAKGEAAVNGIDGTITYHFDKEVNLAPVEDDRGFVDYKDLGLVRNVLPGDVIATITLPTPGANGMDVRGNVLRCIPGKPAKFTIGANTGVTDDGLQLVAKAEGNINFKGGAFVVDNIVKIAGDVNASVGNIDFLGDVEVKGEVTAGFKIKSNSNIIVNGNVNGADLEAAGNVIIKKGCINSQIKAGGSVSINFCEHSKIHCEGDLNSVNFILCDVYCGGVLSTKGNKGGLKGGRYTCLNSVDVCDAGTKNYTKTEISIGGNAILAREKEELGGKVKDVERRIKDIELVIQFLKEKQKIEKLSEEKEKTMGDNARQKILLNVELQKMNKRIVEIEEELHQKQFLSVTCRGVLHPGVTITINDESKKINHENRKCKAYIGEDHAITIGQG